MKKNFFLKNSQKLAIREFHKIPSENPFFSLGQFYQFFFVLRSYYTGGNPHGVWF